MASRTQQELDHYGDILVFCNGTHSPGDIMYPDSEYGDDLCGGTLVIVGTAARQDWHERFLAGFKVMPASFDWPYVYRAVAE